MARTIGIAVHLSEMLYLIVPLFLTTALNTPMSVVGLIEGIAESAASLLIVIWLLFALYGLLALSPAQYYAEEFSCHATAHRIRWAVELPIPSISARLFASAVTTFSTLPKWLNRRLARSGPMPGNP